MKIKFIPLFVCFICLCTVASSAWYRGAQSPLTQGEVEHYLTQIGKQPGNPGQHDMAALRRFLQEDDGKVFYTVNLYKYRDKPNYQAHADKASTGREAFDRFSQVMVRLLAPRASHPVFGSDWTDSVNWDRLVIVRYRSRRDIAEIFASSEFAAASIDKWSGLAKNERFVVQGLHIPELYVLTILVGLILGFYLLVSLRRGTLRRPSR